MYPVSTICQKINGTFLQKADDEVISDLVYDSRRIFQASSSLFFALNVGMNDGHKFLKDAWKKGVRHFVVSGITSVELPGSNVICVENTLSALQSLSAFHRKQFTIPVIGITGSNGKTIVKEWLNQLLSEDYRIVRSPKSFNSQIGVPLSVWEMNREDEIGIFEAGISVPGEMAKLAAVIQPTIGVLTNIGEAHSEGFMDNAQKLSEKLLLFSGCGIVIARNKDIGGKRELISKNTNLLTWGSAANNDFVVLEILKEKGRSEISIEYLSEKCNFTIPFGDDASVENAITCACVLFVLGCSKDVISERMHKLHAIDMRLQLNHSINDCLVINDSYSADITSLKIALDFLNQQGPGMGKTVILSEFSGAGRPDADLYASIAGLVNDYGISRAVVIGEKIINSIRKYLKPSVEFLPFASTEDFISSFRTSLFYKEIILIKGARKFEFERIVKLFERKLHQTVLEINLNSLSHNLKQYQQIVKPGTGIMAMVKAFSYGSGGAEIASVLQYHNTNYLGVAYSDEGVDLVKAGITVPIMVMNTEESSFQALIDHNLQPVIYSMGLMEKLEQYLNEQGLDSYPVHIEIETGMNRLGFSINEMDKVSKYLNSSKVFRVQSVFSHLAASEDPGQDDFTNQQADLLNKAADIIEQNLSYKFIRHISNSAGILRHPHLQMDMVRLGIGLYGIETESAGLIDIQAAATLRSTIAQVRNVKKGESVSYNRRGVANRNSVIATVRIGYADGYSRNFSNGVGKMMIQNKLAPVIGTVCMDMTMIDVTDLPGVKEGEEVMVFGPDLPVQEVASWINTIPYEIMTNVSHRVKRIYFHE